MLIDLAIKTKQFRDSIKDVLGLSFNFERIGKNGESLPPSPLSIAQKYLRECLGLKLSLPIKRVVNGNQQRFYQPVEVSELRQKILASWRQRDEHRRAAKLAEVQAAAATAQSDNGDFDTVPLEQNSVPVGSTGNIVYTEVAAYQVAAYQEPVSDVSELKEALPFCESIELFASVVEDYSVEVIESAIALQDCQPRRQQLTAWYEAIQQLASGENSPQQLEAIATHSPQGWQEKAKTCGEFLIEAIACGIEAVKTLLQPWSEHERWAAILKAEELSPEAMESLIQIDPNWTDLCLVW